MIKTSQIIMNKDKEDNQDANSEVEIIDKSDEFDWDFLLDREWMRTKK